MRGWEGWGSRSKKGTVESRKVANLLAAIEARRRPPLDRFLFALGILFLIIIVLSWGFTGVGPAVQRGKLLPVHELLVLFQTRRDDFFPLYLGQPE